MSVEVLAVLRILRVAVCRFSSGYQQRIIYLFPLLVQLAFETPAKYHQKSILVITFPYVEDLCYMHSVRFLRESSVPVEGMFLKFCFEG